MGTMPECPGNRVGQKLTGEKEKKKRIALHSLSQSSSLFLSAVLKGSSGLVIALMNII